MNKTAVLLLAAALAGAAEAEAQQGARYERWNGATVNSPQDLANNPGLLGNPSVTQTLVNFDAPVNVAGTFVGRITAQFTAPETGLYVFWVASNGHSMAWWSTTQSFVGRAPMARMTRITVPTRNQWTRNCEQKSGIETPVTCPDGVVNPTVNLTAGQTIYLMVVYKDTVAEVGTNVNHASLKWMLPSGLQEGPIPGSRIQVPSAPQPPTNNGRVGLSWDPENTSGNTTGYRILYGSSSGSWTLSRDVGSSTSTSISTLVTGSRIYFVVVAHNSSGQNGPPSNEVSCVPVANASCTSAQASASFTYAASSSSSAPLPPPPPNSGEVEITGEGSAREALQPGSDLPDAPRFLTVDPTVDGKDTWMMDMSRWIRVFAVSWTAPENQPERVVQKDWVTWPDPDIGLPGPMVPAFEIPFAKEGDRFVTKSLYVPGEGDRFAVIRDPDWRTHNAALLVTFQLQVAMATELKVTQTGMVVQLEGGEGFALYLKGMDGNWSSKHLGPDDPFALFLPGAVPWLAVQAEPPKQ